MLCYVVFSYAVLLYNMLCYAMLCYAIPCHAMPCCGMLCCAMLHHALLCHAMLVLYHAMLCHAMLCYAMLLVPCYAMLLCFDTLRCAIMCQAVLCCHSRVTFNTECCGADGVLEAIDMFHTVRAAHLPAVRPAGGSLRPAGAQPAAALRWQEDQHGWQDLSAGQGWGSHPDSDPWYASLPD